MNLLIIRPNLLTNRKTVSTMLRTLQNYQFIQSVSNHNLIGSTHLEMWKQRSNSITRATEKGESIRLREHVEGADNNLLIFPEGTCVNNHYSVMFEKGAFELGSTVCPIAIKYNKVIVDAF
ncbi:hypothetical protein AgCh_001024 [Apium graveolens]